MTRRELWRLLADLVGDGLTLVVATPYLDEAERCTRVVLMHDGLVLADARPAEVPRLMPGTVVEVTASPRTAAFEALAADPAVRDVAVFGTTLHARLEVEADPIAVVRSALAARGIRAAEVRHVRASLEDAFLYRTRAAAAPAATEEP